VDSISPGVAFADYIVESLGQSAVALVIIGPRWLDAASGRKRRLDDPADFVRLEIETALRQGVTVIPLLVMGAVMPHAKRLPESLRGLVARNGLQARPDPDFHHDMDRIIASVEYWLERPRPPVAAPPVAPAAVAPPAATPTQTPAPVAPSRPAQAPPRTPTPAKAGDNPPWSRRYQPAIAIGAFAVLITLLGVTLQSLGVFSAAGAKDHPSLPALAQTATAQASAERTHHPTISYRATAPGSCDTGVLKGDWTVPLEFQHVRCAGDTAVVTGPAILDFTGNGGINANSTISFKMSDFSAKSSSAAVTFQPTFDNQGHGVTLLHVRFVLTAGDRYTIMYLSGDGSKPGGSGFLRPTADASHYFSFSFYPDRDTWEFFMDDHSLPSFTYPASVQAGADHPQTINPVDIIVDRGVTATISDFSIAIAPPA
jgi:cell division septation protein DedD